MNKKAIILLSGGLDSITCLAIAKSQGFDCYTLNFDYGQKSHAECEAAKHIVKIYNVIEHKIFNLPFGELGGSAITDKHIPVPDFKGDHKIPITYVPARNTIFLSIAAGWAEIIGAKDIFIGANAIDYSGYPDCRPDYFAAFQKMINLATKTGIEGNVCNINAPLVYLSKAEIIKLGAALGIDYGMTVSCYRANEKGEACGTCDSCVLRKKGFTDAGIADPTRYYATPSNTPELFHVASK